MYPKDPRAIGVSAHLGMEGTHTVVSPGHVTWYSQTSDAENDLDLPPSLPTAPALSLDCSVDLLFLLEGSSTITLEGFLRLKSFLKRFLQTVIGSDSPSKVGLAVFGTDTRVQAQVGQFKGDTKSLLQAVEALQQYGGETRTGQALRYVTRHGFVSAPVFADVSDDLPRVVVLMTSTPAIDEVVEASRYARDREIFLIGMGPHHLKSQLNNITGNPQRTITYSSSEFGVKIPELKAKICSVDTQGTLEERNFEL